MAVGFTLPYWLRYTIMFMGISCREDMLIMRNVHISLLAVPACLAAALCPAVSSCPGVSFCLAAPPFLRSSSTFFSSSMALSLAGVAAHPSPSILAVTLTLICFLAFPSGSSLGKRKVSIGPILPASWSTNPERCPISSTPVHRVMTHSMVMHSVTASFDAWIAPSVTAVFQIFIIAPSP